MEKYCNKWFVCADYESPKMLIKLAMYNVLFKILAHFLKWENQNCLDIYP